MGPRWPVKGTAIYYTLLYFITIFTVLTVSADRNEMIHYPRFLRPGVDVTFIVTCSSACSFRCCALHSTYCNEGRFSLTSKCKLTVISIRILT
jgi:hypothetical protein